MFDFANTEVVVFVVSERNLREDGLKSVKCCCALLSSEEVDVNYTTICSLPDFSLPSI